MFPSQFLIEKQESRRTKVRTLCEGLQNMESTILEQQTRIQQLENFILWIYEISSEGKANPTIANAIQNFHSGSSMSPVSKKSQYISEKPEESQRNLTFFPISAASSLSRDQTFSIQSVPMNESKIREIHFCEASPHTTKLGVDESQKLQKMPSKGNFLKPFNREINLASTQK